MLKMNDDEEEFKLTLGYEIFAIRIFLFFFLFLKEKYIPIYFYLSHFSSRLDSSET